MEATSIARIAWSFSFCNKCNSKTFWKAYYQAYIAFENFLKKAAKDENFSKEHTPVAEFYDK